MTDRVLVSPAELFGDGVFETVHLRPDGPWLLDQHLARLARSAAMLGFTASAEEAAARVAALPPVTVESALRIIQTRESLHVTVAPIPDAVRQERQSGIRVLSAAVGPPPPWSLAGAKTLSYGPNFAARRWARAQGGDDLLWVSHDGYALEAPTASVVWLTGGELCSVPPEEAGILAGTTAAELLSRCSSAGLRGSYRMVTLDELTRADAIWFASALRGLAEVTSLDGVPRARSPWTPRLLDLLGY
ncbi:4-amino-4-deoxychorismate lyase [Actinoplanes tereljensis]|uniref:Aminotransferase, class IV n=1 Tax=Paractinoplanes tereljensis TaxID=571912 RepID=A0A919NTS1_9ACTN|nr:aminotransferase class IV [Actinoplanes tereljensis]GIF24193.1 putative aminotransferase, class IV [Actinoplanes tereljensis]